MNSHKFFLFKLLILSFFHGLNAFIQVMYPEQNDFFHFFHMNDPMGNIYKEEI